MYKEALAASWTTNIGRIFFTVPVTATLYSFPQWLTNLMFLRIFVWLGSNLRVSDHMNTHAMSTHSVGDHVKIIHVKWPHALCITCHGLSMAWEYMEVKGTVKGTSWVLWKSPSGVWKKLRNLWKLEIVLHITFLSPLRGSPSSTVASRVTPHSYFLL
jgi:hypothetical protein